VKSSEFTGFFIEWLWVDTPHTINGWLEMAVVLAIKAGFQTFGGFANHSESFEEADVFGRGGLLARHVAQFTSGSVRGVHGARQGEGPGPVGGRMGVPRM